MAGDLNAQGEQAREIIRGLDLVQSQPLDGDSFYSLKQGDGHTSWVDHIAASDQLTTLQQVLNTDFPSDHIPITT